MMGATGTHSGTYQLPIQDCFGEMRWATVYIGAYTKAITTKAGVPLISEAQDGFGCPFCHSVTIESDSGNGWPRCSNPWCSACWSKDDPQAEKARAAFLDRYHEEANKEAEGRWRATNHQSALERIREEQEADKAAHARVVLEAQRLGACVSCATKDWRRTLRTAKFTKHKTTTVCPTNGYFRGVVPR